MPDKYAKMMLDRMPYRIIKDKPDGIKWGFGMHSFGLPELIKGTTIILPSKIGEGLVKEGYLESILVDEDKIKQRMIED